MDHSEVMRMGAAEKYLLNELTEEERSQYEEHFFDCQECAEDLKSAAVFIANVKPVLAETAVAQTAVERVDTRDREPPRNRWLAFFWPLPAGAAAAALVLIGTTSYLAVFEVPHLRRELGEATAPQAAPWHFLSVSRSEPPVVRVSKRTRVVGLTLSKSSEASFAYYRCEVREPSGRVLTSAVLLAPPRGDELNVVIPTASLRPGAYELVLHGLESASGPVVAPDFSRYPFTVERE